MLYIAPASNRISAINMIPLDYYQIDPSFGTRRILRAGSSARVWNEGGCGMVYSTIQKEIFAFKDILEKRDKSRYLDWYFIEICH